VGTGIQTILKRSPDHTDTINNPLFIHSLTALVIITHYNTFQFCYYNWTLVLPDTST